MHGWSLNAGRYVGVEDTIASEEDFLTAFTTLRKEFGQLSTKARELEEKIDVISETIS